MAQVVERQTTKHEALNNPHHHHQKKKKKKTPAISSRPCILLINWLEVGAPCNNLLQWFPERREILYLHLPVYSKGYSSKIA
jgi:hypothetical protein